MAAGTLRPSVKGSSAQRSLARRVVDFRHVMPPALVAGYDLPGLTTYIDESGEVRYQPHNLLPDTDMMAWQDNGSVGCSAVSMRPPGIAASSAAIAGTAGTRYRSVLGLNTSEPYAYSAYFYRPDPNEWCNLYCDGLGGAQLAYLVPASGNLVVSENIISASISPAGDGWYRAQMRFVPLGSTRSFHLIGGAGLVMAAPQVNVGSIALPFVDTTSGARHLPALFDNGKRGLRLEGPQTQYLPKNDDLSDAWWGTSGNVSRSAAGNFRGRPRWEIAKTDAAPNAYLIGAPAPLAAGSYVLQVALFAGTSSSVQISLFDTTNQFANASITKVSGPGSAGGAALVLLTGLSPTEPTVYDLRITLASTLQVYLLCYPGGAGSTAIGASNVVQLGNIEPGTVPSSVILNNTTAAMLRPGAQHVISGSEFNRLFPAARAAGLELVANGDFNFDTTGWAAVDTANGGAIGVVSGQLVSQSSSGSNEHARQTIATVSGRRYIVSWTQVVANQPTAVYLSGGPAVNATEFLNGVGSRSHVLAANANNKLLSLVSGGANGSATWDNVSARELDTSVPSLQAFTLFITLADRPEPFASNGYFLVFALNTAAGAWAVGSSMLIRVYANGAIEVGDTVSNAAPPGAQIVGGRNVIGVRADVANKTLSICANGGPLATLANANYSGIGAALARLRGESAAGSQGDGVVTHQTLETLPLMSDAALQAECARRFAIP